MRSIAINGFMELVIGYGAYKTSVYTYNLILYFYSLVITTP